MLQNQHPQYLFNLIAIRHSLFNTRNATNLHFFNTKHSFFKNSFFPSNIIKWNNLDITLHNSRNLFIFKKHILQFIRPSSNSLYNSHNPKDIKLMTRFFWTYVIYKRINLNAVFRIQLILYETVVTTLNLQFIFSSTILCSQTKEALSLALYII